MGLDVHLASDISQRYHELLEQEGEGVGYRNHSLSRTFCNLMCRKDAVSDEPELNQIARWAGLDIGPIFQMEDAPSDEGETAYMMEFAADEAERQAILAAVDRSQKELQGNLVSVLETVNALIQKLSGCDDIPALLAPTERDTLDRQKYFGRFNENAGNGYIGNNFGQDLRNFKSFLEFIQKNGATTVWFVYG